MLREGYSFVLQAPRIAVASGGAIFVVVLAYQTLADGLQAIRARRTQGAATIDRQWSAGLAALLRRVDASAGSRRDPGPGACGSRRPGFAGRGTMAARHAATSGLDARHLAGPPFVATHVLVFGSG